MKISLIRHGRPIACHASRIRAATLAAWLREYEEAGLDPTLPPPDGLKKSLATCALVVTSPAKRALESAAELGTAAERRVAVDAREAPLAAQIVWPFSHRPATFVTLARILWLLGLAQTEESKPEVELRARRLAFQLAAWAREFSHVALVGHGYMNIFLRKQLVEAGWRSSDSRRYGYWSCSHFEKYAPNPSIEPTPGRDGSAAARPLPWPGATPP